MIYFFRKSFYLKVESLTQNSLYRTLQLTLIYNISTLIYKFIAILVIFSWNHFKPFLSLYIITYFYICIRLGSYLCRSDTYMYNTVFNRHRHISRWIQDEKFPMTRNAKNVYFKHVVVIFGMWYDVTSKEQLCNFPIQGKSFKCAFKMFFTKTNGEILYCDYSVLSIITHCNEQAGMETNIWVLFYSIYKYF